jgi:hypothetical protein
MLFLSGKNEKEKIFYFHSIALLKRLNCIVYEYLIFNSSKKIDDVENILEDNQKYFKMLHHEKKKMKEKKN